MFDALFTVAVMNAVFFGARAIGSWHDAGLSQCTYNSLVDVSKPWSAPRSAVKILQRDKGLLTFWIIVGMYFGFIMVIGCLAQT